MSKVLLIGDPHFKASNVANIRLFLAWLKQVIEDKKPDFVINLGDTFHTHNVIRSEVMALVNEHVTLVSQSLLYIILVGNHDMAHHKTPHIHAWLPFMKKYRNLKIIDNPTQANGMAFMPYIDNFAQCQTVIDRYMSELKLIFCHETFKGANFGFLEAKEGVVVPDSYDGLVVSGHVHKAQEMGRVWYPGTPYAQEAADHDEVKGIYLLDTQSGEREFVKSPLPQWVTHKATPATFEAVIEAMNREDKNHLVLVGPGPELAAITDTTRFKELKKDYGFSVKKQSTSSDKSSKAIRTVTTLEGAVTEYVDRIYQGSVDREVLKSKCLEALQ